MTIATLPPVVTALRVFLAADADVTAARTVGGQLGSMNRAQGPAVKYPALRIYRAGGAAVDGYLDRPLLQIEALGAPNDLSDATDKILTDLLSTVVAAIVGRAQHSTITVGSVGCRLASVQIATAMQWGYDDTTKQNRYLARLLAATHRA